MPAFLMQSFLTEYTTHSTDRKQEQPKPDLSPCVPNRTCSPVYKPEWHPDEGLGESPLAQKEAKAWAASYLSGCWETHAQERWRVCGRRSRAFVDPSRWLKMRLRSDIVTIHPAKDSALLLSREGRVLHLLTLFRAFEFAEHLCRCQKRLLSSAHHPGVTQRNGH